ncbi:hypothetical protein [Modestobacter italicus]|uniref:hypothetical protein n=1 Tax=Modestobacter italicus (strain DSM 44449 / CECT 9708 / BC 501) TaxID=2732864 RepID=UPI001C97183A|nr:hypothetical protein [Modestobacter italicus]
MGRHAADDGAGVHPLVAAALQQRPTADTPEEPRHLAGAPRAADGQQGGLGWPGEPGDGTGLGWPAGTEGATDSAADQPADSEPRPARRKLGWRRLFGGGTPAAADPAQETTAA